MRTKFIAIGEALVEIMRPAGGQPLDREGIFEGPYASGAPAIFAVAARRLGAEVTFIGNVGADAFGWLMRRRLEAEGVNTSGLHIAEGYATGVAFIAYAEDGSREFVFHLRHAAAGRMGPDQIDPDWFKSVDWLHISGSTLALNEGCREACWKAVQLTKAAGGRLSFDPNLRPELLPVADARRIFVPFLEAADLLQPTVGEAQALSGLEDEQQAAHFLLKGKERVLVFKRGAAGCSLFTVGGRMDVPGFAVKEVDPTGAGDCFNAGMVLALQAGYLPERAARFACSAGALAVSCQGPMEGAPDWKAVEALLVGGG